MLVASSVTPAEVGAPRFMAQGPWVRDGRRWPSDPFYIPVPRAVVKLRLIQPSFQRLDCSEEPNVRFHGPV